MCEKMQAAETRDSGGGGTTGEAPPMQVAKAMERLGEAGRLIADIRLGADRVLETLFIISESEETRDTGFKKPLMNMFIQQDTSIRKHLEQLRNIGRKLEETQVLNESLRSRSNYWGLHMPLVCPDGAVVAYAWKRQLAGQAGASAVDRTRLALKAFTDQKRRFFPHLLLHHHDNDDDDGTIPTPLLKKSCNQPLLISTSINQQIDQQLTSECKTLSDVLSRLEQDMPNVKVSTYQRMQWFKRASALPSSSNASFLESSRLHSFHTSTQANSSFSHADNVADAGVIDLFFPCVFRALISLHPAGSIHPDAVSFFSPDEGGTYVHARGFSVHHVFKHITDHAATALQFFLGIDSETALYSLLFWICSYQNLFTKVCSKCGRLLSMDKKSSLFLPPVNRSYRQIYAMKPLSTEANSLSRDNLDFFKSYHVGCYSEEV